VAEILLFHKFFFRLSIRALLQRYSPTKLCDGAQAANFLAIFLRPAFPASRVQHISDLHSKFALRPHHVWKYMVDIQSAAAEIRRGIKKVKERNHRAKI